MAKYKHHQTRTVISSSTYYNLSSYEKSKYGEINDSGDFLVSMAIGAATDSALLGGLIGGDMLGGLAGDLMDGNLFD